MSMDVTVNKQEVETPIEGPGRLLREAREALNLGQDEIARRLHLDLKMVKALEEDDYKKLPPPIFVTGYLRNYARLTSLPAEELVASYNRSAGAKLPPIKVMTPSKQGAEHRSDQPVQVATYVMALAVLAVVLGLWWWQSREEPVITTQNAPGTVVPSPLPQPVDDSQFIQVPIPGAAMVPAPTSGEVKPAESSASPAPAATTPSVNTPPAAIKLTFSADAWVQITDANEQRVFYDLGKAGTARTLQGVPPFNVVVGYAPGVKIEYNGAPFDHSRFDRGGRASFVLGKAAGSN